ncbi:Rha family transcriptional regulator [Escherichia coli]|uniref:Rha family transcriptional regulator n=1 Tax=Escherichia coli TaxID=562 RepID=UPI0013033119|nr:Rha family transcriptional regulator [Escherichia coli]EEV6048227.1 Rha family transcriptional regulator [Escherichia coli]EEY3529155.1 Rha family transcriptional regulator [Escherichia coli]EFK8285537.1 Rha family transcriptional regulator [Escherichia coli]EFK8679932.1 Rha family transcriptional regulator [Escherichia coli]EFN7309760.1 Rha family transcriptional regulator [Escherichia coli]
MNTANTAITFSNESPKVFFKDGRLVTTSQAVADYFDKQHKHVLAKIDALDCSPEFTSANFSADVQTVEIGNGAERESRCYLITKDGFMFLVMGFTGKKAARLKEAYIAKFNAMEEELHKQPPEAPNSPTQNDGCALLIHFDKHGQVEFTEKVPADAMVCTLERFKFYLEQHGWIVARKEQLVERLMRI